MHNINYLWLSRLQHWWKRRPEDTDPPRTTSVTCPHLTSPLLRWQTPQFSETLFTPSVTVTQITAFISHRPIDRNHEEWIWAAGSTAAHGSPEHEEVNRAHSRSLCWCLKQQKRRVEGQHVSVGTYMHTQLKRGMKRPSFASEKEFYMHVMWGSTVFTVMDLFSDIFRWFTSGWSRSLRHPAILDHHANKLNSNLSDDYFHYRLINNGSDCCIHCYNHTVSFKMTGHVFKFFFSQLFILCGFNVGSYYQMLVCFVFFPVEIWAAGTLVRTEERHHSLAGVCEQLDGPARAPGSPYREPGAHVAIWNQRVESLQWVCDGSPSLTYSL